MDMSTKKPPTMAVYITKYALTKGVVVTQAEECSSGYGVVAGTGFDRQYHSYKAWARTKEGAAQQVRLKVEAAMASLEKKRARLHAILEQLDRGELPMAPAGKAEAAE